MYSKLTPILMSNFRRTFWFPQEKTKLVATRHSSLLQNIPKCFCGRDSAADRTAEVYSPPQTSWTWRPVLGEAGKDRIRKEREGRKGRLQKRKRGRLTLKNGLGLPFLKCDCSQASLIFKSIIHKNRLIALPRHWFVIKSCLLQQAALARKYVFNHPIQMSSQYSLI